MIDAVYVLLVFTIGFFAGCFLRYGLCRIIRIEMKEHVPFAECVNGLLYVLVFQTAGWTLAGGIFCICASTLLAIGIIDLKTFEIPIECNILIGILGCIHLFGDLPHWQEYLAGLFAASGLLGAAYFLSRGKGIGGGDIKLMAAAGFLLGWEKAILALFAGAVSGVIVHILRMEFQKKGRILAFGPYLAFGIFTAMLYGDRIIEAYLLIFG